MESATTKPVTVRELHHQAMDLASESFLARQSGDTEKEVELAAASLELEERAARMLPIGPDSEPTRSILFRSAATLAHQAGQDERALVLIQDGLTGETPAEIEQELLELKAQIELGAL